MMKFVVFMAILLALNGWTRAADEEEEEVQGKEEQEEIQGAFEEPQASGPSSSTGPTKACAPDQFCGSPAESGYCANAQHCRATVMWYFDSNSGQCLQFHYYGTGGNYNKFYSKEECVKTCNAKGYGYYQKGKLCTRCPNPVYYGSLKGSGKSLCLRDDCNCDHGEKCCPNYFKLGWKKFTIHVCEPSTMAPCDDPYAHCSAQKAYNSGGHSAHKAYKSGGHSAPKAYSGHKKGSSRRHSSRRSYVKH